MEELKQAGIAWIIIAIIVIGLFIYSTWDARRTTSYRKKNKQKTKKTIFKYH